MVKDTEVRAPYVDPHLRKQNIHTTENEKFPHLRLL